MKNLLFGAIFPHPPILVAEIGGTRIKEAENTRYSCETVASKIAALNPDVLVIMTPHGHVSKIKPRVYRSAAYSGDFKAFGFPNLSYSFSGDTELSDGIFEKTKDKIPGAEQITESRLDHGVLVPLSFIRSAGCSSKIVPIAVSLASLDLLYDFGAGITEAAIKYGKTIAVIASSDMSHKLTKDAPSGFSPKGAEFDNKLVSLVESNDVQGIINFDDNLAQDAGQDALWSIAILLGALKGMDYSVKLHSYEGPFGVGYMVAEYGVK